MSEKNILIETDNLHQYFDQGRGLSKKGRVHALNGVSLNLNFTSFRALIGRGIRLKSLYWTP